MAQGHAICWTDVGLQPDACRLLADAGISIDAAPAGGAAGMARADAAIVGSRFEGNAAAFAGAPRLRLLARVGIGVDRIDLAAATAAGVQVVNTPEAPTESTAEFTLALMLAVARRLVPGIAATAHAEWAATPAIVGQDLAGKTLGLVGCGRIGRRVAGLAQAFGMTVQAYDPAAASLPAGVRASPGLHDLLQTSDVISIHAPMSPATRGLLGTAEFAVMKPGAILINTARGSVVDEAALVAALRDGRLAGAGIDVWEHEPPGADHPLLHLPNVVATPHMAAFTREGRQRSHLAAARQVCAGLRGERPEFLLNPEVWPRRRPAGA